jgi:exonuclease SbcC
MRISQLKIENLYGIEQIDLDGKSIELVGSNGVGKSSVLDAIRLALTNNSKRKYIVKNGETEGRVYVKLDNGVTIDRKKRTNKSDYKSIKDENGNEITGPEAFLKDIFTPLQLEPVEFLSMSEQEQNRILLNLIEFNKDKHEFINQKFGEEISWVDYNNSILEILNEIQAKDGKYYQDREEINRNARNALAIVNDIAKDIPEGYDVKKWRDYTLSDKYEELNKNKDYNNKIDRSIAYKEDYNNKIENLNNIESKQLSDIKLMKEKEKAKIEKEIAELEKQLNDLRNSLINLDNKYRLQEAEIESNLEIEKAKLDENIKIANKWADKSKIETETLENELKIAEEMKGHINEYDRMTEMQNNVEKLREQSETLTNKIELARTLPGEILKEVNIPVKNLTVENGIPLVDGLPVRKFK